MTREWFTAAELKAFKLPDLPGTEQGINKRARTDGWKRQRSAGSSQAWEYHLSALPTRAQASLLRKLRKANAGPDLSKTEIKVRLASEDAWARFDALPEARKDKARMRLGVIQDVRAMVVAGTAKEVALALVCRRAGVPTRTFYEWESRIHGIEAADWLPNLVDHYVGRQKTAEMPADAWDFFLADYLRLEKPPAATCYARLEDLAAERGWSLPSLKTFLRRIEREIPAQVVVLKRDGDDALERLYPAQRRDRSSLHAMEAVNCDGHIADVFVKWPDGMVARPVLFVFQDLYSGKILSWRIDRTENTQSFRLAFGDMIERWGIPERVLIDNTRVAANKKMTGGIANRFRFKVKDDDPMGLIPALGARVHWAQPYHGQAKPIERAFGDLCNTIAKAPECAGAYTGNKPTAKPENYGSKAVPLADFIALAEREIARHNARPGRANRVCGGVKSFDDAFAESYETAPIRKAVAEELRRLWLLESEAVTARQPDGHIDFLGNRYWHQALNALIGTKLVLRFDPEFLKQPVHVYRLDGSFVATADCVADAGFFDQDAAKTHNRARKEFKRAVKAQGEAMVRMDASAAAAIRPQGDGLGPAPEAKVVKPVWKAATRKGPQAAPISAAEQARLDALAAEMEAPVSTVVTLDTVEARFRRVLEIEGRAAAGQYVPPDDLVWAERQARLPDIRIKREMYEEFGEAVLTA